MYITDCKNIINKHIHVRKKIQNENKIEKKIKPMKAI